MLLVIRFNLHGSLCRVWRWTLILLGCFQLWIFYDSTHLELALLDKAECAMASGDNYSTYFRTLNLNQNANEKTARKGQILICLNHYQSLKWLVRNP